MLEVLLFGVVVDTVMGSNVGFETMPRPSQSCVEVCEALMILESWCRRSSIRFCGYHSAAIVRSSVSVSQRPVTKERYPGNQSDQRWKIMYLLRCMCIVQHQHMSLDFVVDNKPLRKLQVMTKLHLHSGRLKPSPSKTSFSAFSHP